MTSGAVSCHHFVFRFYFKNWRVLLLAELIIFKRTFVCSVYYCGSAASSSTEANAAHSTPIRKLTRNRGLIVPDDYIVEDSLEKDPRSMQKTRPNKGKCHLIF
ncbi:hypothetical protein KSP40_PGU003487 [Platanthera guangdongensis]|uniref:Uncharacterized protein n=1 Tax=Platanthera guangdongensis TaxID=2320717 RepID=A0ABR2MD86_9ASPA